ncbi:tRNA(Ile)-lysidine synthase [Ruaniaceae bacterium KH17]|nr:tRNA(Ile)-lysidine synthase [Ruaniaceae bacterium KH17]
MAGPHPAVAAARNAVAALGLPAGSRVVAGVSGGADSLALAAALAFVAPRQGWVARAVVVNHGLRPESAADADRAVALCRSLGLEAEVVRVEVAAGPAGPEGEARAARLGALLAAAGVTGVSNRGDEAVPHAGAPTPDREVAPPSEVTRGENTASRIYREVQARESAAAVGARHGEARESRANPEGWVLLGHTLDDQAETVLLGLARGSGTRSLAGMAPVQGRILRPLLGLTRAETEAVCEALGLTPIEDPSNALDGPWRRADGGPLLRSAVRHTVLPVLERELGPRITQALARTAALARADADALDELAAAAYQEALVLPLVERSRDHGADSHAEDGPAEAGEPREVRLAVGRLLQMSAAVRTRVLNRAIIEAGGTELSAVHIWTVDALVTDYHGQGAADLPGFVRAEREGTDLVIRRIRRSR